MDCFTSFAMTWQFVSNDDNKGHCEERSDVAIYYDEYERHCEERSDVAIYLNDVYFFYIFKYI